MQKGNLRKETEVNHCLNFPKAGFWSFIHSLSKAIYIVFSAWTRTKRKKEAETGKSIYHDFLRFSVL